MLIAYTIMLLFKGIQYKRDNFRGFLFVSNRSVPFWKEIFYARKEFAPRGRKFFPFWVQPFSEGSKNNFDSNLP